MEALSGNSSDKESYRQTLNAHPEQLRDGAGLSRILADSALYTANTLQDLGDFLWITRVPDTIGGVRELILAVSDDWLVVYTRSAHERAEKTVNRQHLKQSQAGEFVLNLNPHHFQLLRLLGRRYVRL